MSRIPYHLFLHEVVVPHLQNLTSCRQHLPVTGNAVSSVWTDFYLVMNHHSEKKTDLTSLTIPLFSSEQPGQLIKILSTNHLT